jgi:hypothetical protein
VLPVSAFSVFFDFDMSAKGQGRVAGKRMAQPVYPSFGNTWCVPALTLRDNNRLVHRNKQRRYSIT